MTVPSGASRPDVARSWGPVGARALPPTDHRREWVARWRASSWRGHVTGTASAIGVRRRQLVGGWDACRPVVRGTGPRGNGTVSSRASRRGMGGVTRWWGCGRWRLWRSTPADVGIGWVLPRWARCGASAAPRPRRRGFRGLLVVRCVCRGCVVAVGSVLASRSSVVRRVCRGAWWAWACDRLSHRIVCRSRANRVRVATRRRGTEARPRNCSTADPVACTSHRSI